MAAFELPIGVNPCSDKCCKAAGKRSRLARVLVVDGYVDAADTLALLVTLAGYEVVAVYDGLSAVTAAVAFRPDVILSDLALPKLDGLRLARQLRATPGMEGVLLVALTGYGRDEDRRRAIEAGFDHHLLKTVDFDGLQRVLVTATGKGSRP